MPLLRELRGAFSAFALVVCGVLALASFDIGIPGQALLQSLRFHLAAALLGLVVLLFISGAWWRGVLFMVVFALSAGQGALIVYRQQEARALVSEQPSRPLFKMLSFNLLQSNSANGRRLATYIENSGADVVALMEAGPVKPFAAEIMKTYPYISKCAASGPCDTFLLSRTPLTNVAVGSLGRVWQNRLVTAHTLIDGVDVSIIVAHLVKPYFDDAPNEEAARLALAIAAARGPLVLAGDFNAAAWSRNINWLYRFHGLIPGPSYPATWPVRLGPFGVPIDNMWTRGPLFISSIEALDDSMGSNHRGIMATLSLAQPSATSATAP